MNEDLIERFKRHKGAHRNNKIRAEILLLPQKLNNKVRQYYEPVKKPSDAGPWLSRPEMPTSDEVMDIDTDNASNPDIVEIVPNRETGGWESQGKLSLHSPAVCSITDIATDAYLSAHYELLREDTIGPLREAICHVRKGPDLNEDAFKSTVGIYQDVSRVCRMGAAMKPSLTNNLCRFTSAESCALPKASPCESPSAPFVHRKRYYGSRASAS